MPQLRARFFHPTAIYRQSGHTPDRRRRLTPEERIGRDIEPQPNGCWLWRGDPDAYGKTSVDGEFTHVHRWVYEVLVGPIPEGHHLHHECETKGCCNPAHLTPLTPRDHKARHLSRQ